MVYALPDKKLKDRILGDNSIPPNVKKTLIINSYKTGTLLSECDDT